MVDVIDETADSRTIVLQPGRNWRRHRAGRHIRIGVSVDGRRYTRTYTLSSSLERPDGNISITVKVLEGGRLSEHLVRNLEVGEHIPIGLPQGEFVLPEARPVKPLFITAGGMDRDIGYEIFRITPEQKWHPVHLAQPFLRLPRRRPSMSTSCTPTPHSNRSIKRTLY